MKEKIEALRKQGFIIPDDATSVNNDGSWMDKEGIEHAPRREGVVSKIPSAALYGTVAAVVAVFAGLFLWLFVIDHTKLVNDTLTVEAGKEVVFVPEDHFEGLDEEATKADFTVDTTAVNTSVPGEYTVTVTYKEKSYDLTAVVQDTTAPVVKVNTAYVITNDAVNLDVSDMITVNDVSETTVTVGKFVKVADSQIITDETVTAFTDTVGGKTTADLLAREDFVPVSGKYDINGELIEKSEETEETESVESTEVVEETETAEDADVSGEEAVNYMSHEDDGIYSAVVMAEDAYGNVGTGEIIVIYDTTAPELFLADVEAATLENKTVKQSDVTAEPDYDLQGAGFYDTIDGEMTDDAVVTITETDADKHVWTVKAEVTDRAGNKNEASYTITVEKKATSKPSGNSSGSNGGSGSSSGGGTGSGTASSNGVVYSGGMYVLNYNGFSRYWTEGEPNPILVDWTKQLYDAGYYNPQLFPDGVGYGMIAPASTDLERAEIGQYLQNYVNGLGYSYGNAGGYNMGEDGSGNDVYYVYVENIF